MSVATEPAASLDTDLVAPLQAIIAQAQKDLAQHQADLAAANAAVATAQAQAAAAGARAATTQHFLDQLTPLVAGLPAPAPPVTPLSGTASGNGTSTGG